ncbi:MAG: hypothetical protein LUC85_02715 [Bacteroidales bacterium]|nr:hypothetical protein [Bacteroidales bacterium]MCD8393731.1 hypothetical protein [Bacteroidales bacterium]
MKTQELHINQLTVILAENPGKKLFYLLTPFPLPAQKVESWVQAYHCSMAVVSGMDWDNDLTPWPAPAVPKGTEPFQGRAPEFLKEMVQTVVPQVEASMQLMPSRRALCGISLSGLFSTWAYVQTDLFHDLGSISGSFWYQDFVQWLEGEASQETSQANPERRCYFSLGNKEGGATGNATFADIQAQTRRVVEIFRQMGYTASFEQTLGNHYVDPEPRIRALLKALS